jgi:hypothetical protein
MPFGHFQPWVRFNTEQQLEKTSPCTYIHTEISSVRKIRHQSSIYLTMATSFSTTPSPQLVNRSGRNSLPGLLRAKKHSLFLLSAYMQKNNDNWSEKFCVPRVSRSALCCILCEYPPSIWRFPVCVGSNKREPNEESRCFFLYTLDGSCIDFKWYD